MTCQLIEVNESHISELLEIYNDYVMNSTATFHERPLSAEEMRRVLYFNAPPYQSYCIVSDGRNAGYCIISRFHEREAYNGTATVSVYLKPEATGKGLGSAALSLLEVQAVQKGFHTLMALICAENEASIRLFERCGYTKCGHLKEVGRKFDRLLDVVYYQKILA